MIVAVATAPPAVGITLDRKGLLSVLERAQAVVPTRSYKPIFGGVRLHARDDVLTLAVTDGGVSLLATLEANGTLPACVVPCRELIRRMQASKDPSAVLALRSRPQRLILNGGRVEHALPTFPLDDFPPVPDRWRGEKLVIDPVELHEALAVASCAMARDTSRYAISGVLLESDDQGCRLVATDGHRLVAVDLQMVDTRFKGQALLPARLVKLVEKLSAGEEVPLLLAVKPNATDKGEKLPADLFVAGPRWLVACQEADGRFPVYRDVVPASASRFAVDRKLLAETLRQVMLATGDRSRAVAVSLRPRSLELSASSAESGSASAKLPAKFLGGGDSVIHTGFDPKLLLEAVNTLSGEQIVLDVAQNGYAPDNTVYSKAASLYEAPNQGGNGAEGNAAESSRVRWVVMPLNMGYPATREYLGSNFKEELAHAS
jgi:DNA polymerase-3 subunit beta